MTSASLRRLATYIVPLKSREPAADELVDYLRWLSTLVPVIVADGSAPSVFRRNRELCGDFVKHIWVSSRAVNGKVAGVIDGVATAETPYVVIADDDVRYDGRTLSEVVRLLSEQVAVVPQNYFAPLPWHARWDSARSLINRSFGHDYAGTTAVRRLALVDSGGYCGAVLFENLELLRTLAASGHRIKHADDVFVLRRPPEFRHFVGQRVRQAFDSSAQLPRQILELSIVPCLVGVAMLRPSSVVGLVLAPVAMAEIGRRRAHGRDVFPPTLPLWAPCWVLERGVCAWLALLTRLRGGVRYAGQRLTTSAHPRRTLRPPACPEQTRALGCRCTTALRPAALTPLVA
jgi:glycosyl transferase family 21